MRSTWVPRGKTPILRHRFNWKQPSMAGACCYRADASSAELVFGMRAGSYGEDSLIEFVGELHTHLAGKKVTLLWDGPPSQRSKKMKRCLASQRRWLVVERLPPMPPSSNRPEARVGFSPSEIRSGPPASPPNSRTPPGAQPERSGTDVRTPGEPKDFRLNRVPLL